MLEKTIEKQVCDEAKKRGWQVYKFTSPGARGVPDRMLIKNGKTYFIEFKKSNGKISVMQQYHLNKLNKTRTMAVVVNSVDSGIEYLDKWDGADAID